MSRSRTSALALGLAVMSLSFTACGDGGGGDRPSVGELAEDIRSDGDGDTITEEQAECVAEAYVDSDISDEGLTTLVDSGDVEDIDDVDISDDDREAFEAATTASRDCIGAGP